MRISKVLTVTLNSDEVLAAVQAYLNQRIGEQLPKKYTINGDFGEYAPAVFGFTIEEHS